MKKALSVLLVAAAIFGFYGSAVSVNDILACKDYWEEAGEKSTADMNKLEDGLNQLKDNEQAYLDGQDQLAEGEKALADGEAQYEAGLKSYEEAPAKLAAGEKALAEGEKSYSQLKTLINGLKKAQKHGVKKTKKHDEFWHDGYTFDTYKDNGKAGLKPGRKYIVQTIKGMPTEVATIEALAGLESGTIAGWLPANGSYEKFDKGAQKGSKTLGAVESTLAGFIKDAGSLCSAATTVYSAISGISEGGDPPSDGQLSTLKSAAETLSGSKYSGINNLLNQLTAEKMSAMGTSYSEVLANVKAGAVASLVSGGNQYAQLAKSEKTAAAEAYAAGDMVGYQEHAAKAQNYGDAASGYYTKAGTLAGALVQLMASDGEVVTTLKGYDATLTKVVDTLNAWHDGYNTLVDGKAQLASTSEGIPYAFKNMVTNPTIKKAIKKYDPKLMSILKKYKGSRLNNDEFGDEFDKDLVYLSKKVIPRALNVLKHVKSSAQDQLADGRAQLAQGRADYAAAPGKLADAEQQLADGRKQLEDGKAQLAQYEDGEQQVRDGLATLVGTEPDLDLESIVDRLNGDTDFDNGDEHLDIDEGLAAVDVGRGYQADDGVLITKEIMARAVGTAGLLAAGVLAVIAAILSFLKKNKGAGVFAILAAAAGAFGAFYGSQAGTYFSSIAGSTVGATGWIAAGILGGVALVHAIVHFAAPKTAA